VPASVLKTYLVRFDNSKYSVRASAVVRHASWLNMVEIEIGVLVRQCLDRRIESHTKLAAETAVWEKQRNAARARIKWRFTTERARAKMGRAYAKSASNQRVKTSVQRC
jgi:hypothetical protein